MTRKVHFESIRFKNNAGMEYPECRANGALVDTELRWETSGNAQAVTCKHCKKAITKSWFGRITSQL